MELSQTGNQKEKKKLKSEDSLRGLWDNIKYNNIHTVGFSKEDRDKEAI